MRAITLKVDDAQLKLLDAVSRSTHIPKSALIRKGIELVLQQTQGDVVSLALRKEIDAILKEDHNLLKRLAK